MNKRILLLNVFLILTSFTPSKHATKWVITQNSSLNINGSTNINRFSCAISNYAKTDTITISTTNDQVLLSGMLNLDVKDFECNNAMMTHQFRKTLKHGVFPVLGITFISLREFPGVNQKTTQIKGLVALKIAGVTKRYEIGYELVSLSNTLTLRGIQQVNFSDFKLSAPKPVGNLIKAKDELKIVFELKMRLVE